MKRSFQELYSSNTFGSDEDDGDTQAESVNTPSTEVGKESFITESSANIKTKEIREMELFIKQLLDSKTLLERKALLTLLITYFSPSSDNFILNGLSFLQHSSSLLSYLKNVFQYLSTDVGGVDPLYDRDLIVLFIRFVASIVSSNVERQDIANLMEDIDWLSYLVSVHIA